MSCDEKSNELVKNLIYRNKVVVFGFSDDEHTVKAIQFFKCNFNHKSQNVFLDKEDDNIYNSVDFKECLKIRTKTDKIPIVYLNGMSVGGWRSIENMHYRRDLEILF